MPLRLNPLWELLAAPVSDDAIVAMLSSLLVAVSLSDCWQTP